MSVKGQYQPFTVIKFDEPMEIIEMRFMVPKQYSKAYRERLMYYSDVIAMEIGM